jgi:hypothetical protein
LIQSRATRQFWRLLSRLPAEIQQEAKRVYRLFRANPAHPGLHFKKLEGHDSIYSARISLGYRQNAPFSFTQLFSSVLEELKSRLTQFQSRAHNSLVGRTCVRFRGELLN